MEKADLSPWAPGSLNDKVACQLTLEKGQAMAMDPGVKRSTSCGMGMIEKTEGIQSW